MLLKNKAVLLYIKDVAMEDFTVLNKAIKLLWKDNGTKINYKVLEDALIIWVIIILEILNKDKDIN